MKSELGDIIIDCRDTRPAVGIFEQVQSLLASECRRLGYWDAAMKVYDRASLWK